MARQRNPATAPTDRLFLDTGYVIARFNRRDEYHNAAKQLAEVVIVASELWTTDAVLLEIAATFSAPAYRPFAMQFGMNFMAATIVATWLKLPAFILPTR